MLKVLTEGCEPTKGSKYSACIDLYASEDVVIGAGETKLVGLGVCIDLDKLKQVYDQPISGIVINFLGSSEQDFIDFLNSHYLQLMLRSSLGKKGLILPNGVGVIDLDYKDEIKILLHSYLTTGKDIDGVRMVGIKNDIVINKGDKIAQITLLEHKGYLFGVESDTERDGGFGSTGE